jgi:hypothetical protein
MSYRVVFFVFSLGLATGWAQPQITVVSATSKQVQLTWTAAGGASSYSVFRIPATVTSTGVPGDPLKISLPAENPPIVTVNGASYTDLIPDPYATYSYCVRPAGASGPCNSVLVGPPPLGFNIVVPSTPDTSYTVGVFERMVLDGNGDPAMAYYVIDPNGDGDESDDTIYFVSWNRAKYTWNKPVAVAVTPAGFSEGPTMPLSLAYDAATGMWGLAYNQAFPEGYSEVVLSTSIDGGLSWNSQSISGQPYDGILYEPLLCLWNGAFYAAFLTDAWFDGSGTLFPANGTGFLYVTGNVTDASSRWTAQPAPFPGDYINAYYTGSLALDSNHAPGLAFNVANDTFLGIAFWRPGQPTSTLVGRNDGYTTNDNPDISLAFFGTEPRIVTDAEWTYGSHDPDSEPADLWAMRATNASGTLWLAPVDVPPDNVNMMELPWITTGSRGQTAIVMASNHDPEGQGMAWGFPKIARSTDFITFQTTAPAPLDNPSFYPNNMCPVLRYGGNDKLWLAFNNNDEGGGIGIGLVLWREQ